MSIMLDREQIACYNTPMTNKTNLTATATDTDDWGEYGEWIWDNDVLLSDKALARREERDAYADAWVDAWADDMSDD